MSPRSSLAVALADLPDDLLLAPVSFLAAPLTVATAKKKAASPDIGLDPDAHLWRCREWQTWAWGGMGEIWCRGGAVFRFTWARR